MTDDDLKQQWHRAVCQELESRVKDRKFLVWVEVEPAEGECAPATPPEQLDPQAWEAVAQSVEEWLSTLEQAKVDRDNHPRHEVRIADLRLDLSAAPKKSKRHGTGSLVANPFPGIANFTGSYSAGPAEPFDPDD